MKVDARGRGAAELHEAGARVTARSPPCPGRGRSSCTRASITTTRCRTRSFGDLEIPPPDINLGVGSASHAVQTARIMERFEPVALEHRPDWVVVYGDVNSTAAAALVCSKIGGPARARGGGAAQW